MLLIFDISARDCSFAIFPPHNFFPGHICFYLIRSCPPPQIFFGDISVCALWVGCLCCSRKNLAVGCQPCCYSVTILRPPTLCNELCTKPPHISRGCSMCVPSMGPGTKSWRVILVKKSALEKLYFVTKH